MALASTLEYVALVDVDILVELERQGTCTFRELETALSGYAWNQVFAAVDRLSRNGHIALTRHGRFDYRVSIAPCGAPTMPDSQ